jgi:hypothetical protein
MNKVTVCTVCGAITYEDEAATHPCNPRRVAELEQRVENLTAVTAALAGELAEARADLAAQWKAWEIAAGIEGVPDVIVPAQRPDLRLAYSREDAKRIHPSRAAGRSRPRVTLRVVGAAGCTARGAS